MLTITHPGDPGTPPDPNVWRVDVSTRPNELQAYTARGNAFADGDGHLVLEARRETVQTPQGVRRYSSARLDTKGRLPIQPGSAVEIEALLPNAPGCFPALWFVGSNQASVGYVQAGELDLIEVAGGWRPETALLNAHAGYYPAVLERMAAAQGTTVADLQARQVHYQTGWRPETWVDDFDPAAWHTYRLEPDGNGVRWWIDDHVVMTRTKADFDALGVQWPWNKPTDLIVNLAVGSAGGVPDGDGTDQPWSAQMLLGRIRIGRFKDFR